MSFEEKFDKILRQRVGESEFPFDAGNWDKASRMIDAERGASLGAKTSKYFLLFGALFLVIAGITFFGITMNGGSSEKNTLAENKNNPEMNNDNQANGSKPGAALVSVNSDNKNNESGSSENNNEGNTGSQNSNQNNYSNANNLSNSSEVSSNGTSENANDKQGAGNEVSNNAATHSNDVSANNDLSEKNTNGAGDKSAKDKTKSQGGGSMSTGTAKNSLGNTIKVSHDNKKTGRAGKKSTDKNKKSEKNNEDILNASKEEVVEKESAENLEMRSSVLQIWNKEGILKSTAYDFIRIYDNDYFTKNKRKTHSLNAEIGSTYLFGWETANGRDAKGFNAFAGMNYGIYLSKRSSISLGVQLYNVSNIKQAFYSKAAYDYDFGSNGNYTNITTNALYYFSIPVKAYVNIPKTDGKVGLGINTGLCFNGKSTMETYTEKDKVKSNVVETKQKGYYEGVNNVNILLSAFYNHRLSRRISVNGEVIYGLSDTYKNSVSNSNAKQKNIGVRLSLQYTLFDK